MLKINQTQKEELGGFKSLEIILLKDVLNCPYILTNANALELTYRQFFEEDISILPVEESIYMRSRPKRKASGILYSLDAGFQVKYIEPNLEESLANYHLKQVIVKGFTNSNKVVIYGSAQNPLLFYYEPEHSTSIETTSKIRINCKAEISQKPVIAAL